MHDAAVHETANGHRILKGRCGVCNTRMNRFLPNVSAPRAQRVKRHRPDVDTLLAAASE